MKAVDHPIDLGFRSPIRLLPCRGGWQKVSRPQAKVSTAGLMAIPGFVKSHRISDVRFPRFSDALSRRSAHAVFEFVKNPLNRSRGLALRLSEAGYAPGNDAVASGSLVRLAEGDPLF